ncbi:hypothetical protein FB451DRAFT_1403528 [Mycena latifolia]|nr:hypothetical protein FB451DRAFT_1403528 [Mycena latifolia]
MYCKPILLSLASSLFLLVAGQVPAILDSTTTVTGIITKVRPLPSGWTAAEPIPQQPCTGLLLGAAIGTSVIACLVVVGILYCHHRALRPYEGNTNTAQRFLELEDGVGVLRGALETAAGGMGYRVHVAEKGGDVKLPLDKPPKYGA